MKKSRHLPFYLPNFDSNAEDTPVFDPEDNLYNNPDENVGQGFVSKKQGDAKSMKNREKDRFDEI